jgi:hypothetical protein
VKWGLAIAFTLAAFCGRVFSVVFCSPKLIAFFSWPSLLLATWFDWSPMDRHALALHVGDWVGWALAGFVVGTWLDARGKRIAAMKKKPGHD